MQLREAYPQIAKLGAEAVAIASKPAAIAQNLTDSGFPFPLLMDPDHTVRKAAGIDRMAHINMLKPSGLLSYAKSLGSWRSFNIKLDEANQRPAVFILDANQAIAWKHVGDTLGDYSSVDTILAELAKL